eukprot:TRINITY_DN305_c0_g1_i2.p1 TRINITY_DN305_c0_g1~~TRINITY_DN305_c0_g1_i2.p1  ORF type:complete len:763 (+),score=130.43 TRINITY_DN305_c0_g1_i2:173-2461(+)
MFRFTLFVLSFSYIYFSKGESCTLGEFPYESVSLAEDTFVTYTGCESSNGETINNYLLHLVISRGTHNIKLDLQPYFIKELFEGNANIVLSTSHPVTWTIRTHHIANTQNINVHFLNTSTVEAPAELSLIPELNLPSDFAGSLHWTSQLLDNSITLATTASYANYMLLHLGNNFQFTGGFQTCQELTAVINTTAARLFISQRLKVYHRNEVTNSLTNRGCVNGFQSQVGKPLVIGVFINYTVPSSDLFSSFPFGNSQPEVRLYVTTEQIAEQGIELVLVSSAPVKWIVYQIGFLDVSFNIKVSDGSAVDVISNSISYLTTEVESTYSINPSELLEQLKTEFKQVNLFSSSGLADEIHIRVIENVSNAAFYDFNKFLRESIAFELCSRDTYLFCFNVSTVSILSEYSYELSISNDTVCRSAEKEVIPCSLRESLTLTNPQWVCYEIVTDTPQQEIEYYSTEVGLQITTTANETTLPIQRRSSLPESSIERAQTILGFLGSTGVLSCTSTPENPSIQPPVDFSIEVLNNNKEVVTYPAYVETDTVLRTNIKISDVTPGMLPIFLSCYLSTTPHLVEATDYQTPVMELIKGSCPTQEGRLFKLSASYHNSYLLNQLFLQISLVNSLDPFVMNISRGKTQLIDTAYLHCQPTLCQLDPTIGQENTLNTGYPMCSNLTSICHMTNAGDTQIHSLFPNLYASPYVSTGNIVFNTYNRPVSITTTTSMTSPPCVNSTVTASSEPTCNFKQSSNPSNIKYLFFKINCCVL